MLYSMNTSPCLILQRASPIQELRIQIVELMEETKSNPEEVKNFFLKPSVRYASDDNDLLPEQ